MNPYETKKLVDEYLLFHYGSSSEVLPHAAGPNAALDFAVRTPSHAGPGPFKRALDLGCAVGRSAFELSKVAENVVGIDFSQAFIDAATSLKQGETLGYQRLEEASSYSELSAQAPAGARLASVTFEQGDAMNLRPDLGTFDLVHAANLICRLPEPTKLLQRLPQLVEPRGTLILATPCTWLEEYTPRENFPNASTFEWLQDQLGPEFELLEKTDEPFLIRETARKFQWTVSLLTKWRRVG